MKYSVVIALLFAFILTNCGGSDSGKTNKALLPKASGRAGEMIVVMDSTQWRGQLGDSIRSTFRAEVQGLPREEYMFKLNRVDPQRMNDILKSVKNLLFVVTLDSNTPDSKVIRNYFTKSSLKRIKDDASLFVFTDSDVYARGQKVMYLFGQNSKKLADNISKNKEKLQDVFNQAENNRLKLGLYKAKELDGISKMLMREHDCFMRIPFGYKLVVNQPGFVWLRQINDESDKDVFITYKPYTSEKAFTQENIIAMRDSVAKNQLFEDPADPSSHIITETSVPFIPVSSKQVNLNGHYAMETHGLWKTNNNTMGGPFIGYTVVDEEKGRLYYIEGFLYSPGKSQREFMRELEVILSTFQTKADRTKVASK